MRRLALALAALFLLPAALAPAAVAWPGSSVQATPTALAPGDLLRYDFELMERGGTPVRGTLLVSAQGPSEARDKYGILRETDAYLIESIVEGKTVRLEKCHALRGFTQAVRTDYLMGGPDSVNIQRQRLGTNTLPIEETTVSIEGRVLVSYSETPCVGRGTNVGSTLDEGDRRYVRAVVPHAFVHSVLDDNPWSKAAEATTFHGRDALRFTFPVEEGSSSSGSLEGTAIAVLADGLPEVARFTFEGTCTPPERHYGNSIPTNTRPVLPVDTCIWKDWQDEDEGKPAFPFTLRLELTGYVRGANEAPAYTNGHGLPAENPDARFLPVPEHFLDDEALQLAYPFREAFTEMLDDPRTKLKEYLESRPDAMLLWAEYDRRNHVISGSATERLPTSLERTDGGWWVLFADATSYYYAGTGRTAGAQAGPVPVEAPAKVVTNWGMGTPGKWDGSYFMAPTQIPSSATLAALLEREGLAPGTIESLTYHGSSYTSYIASDVSRRRPAESPNLEGTVVSIDGREASTNYAAATVYTEETTGVLSVFPGRDDPTWRGGLGPGSGLPPLGTGLAVGAAALAGAALVALAVKLFLLPFYTRLRRDRLLENPVRARIYELVRANPGIHRAEVAHQSGLGEGNTRHHLDKLVEGRLLAEMHTESGGFVRYYAAGEMPPALARREALLRAGSNRRVYELLSAEPHLTLREAGARLGLSAASVHLAAKRLREAGLLPAAGTVEAPAERARV